MYHNNNNRAGRPAAWAQMGSVSSSSTGSIDQPAQQQQQQQQRQRQPTSLTSSATSTSTSSSARSTTAAAAAAAATKTPNQLGSTNLALYQTASSQQPAQSELDEEVRLEADRKLRLQLYVFVSRCVSYPFNAKQANAQEMMSHRSAGQIKLRDVQFEQIGQLHLKYMRSLGLRAPAYARASTSADLTQPGGGQPSPPGSLTSSSSCASSSGTQQQQQQFAARASYPHTNLLAKQLNAAQLRLLDEAYERVQVTFSRKYLMNERMRALIEMECCSQYDLRELFRKNAEQILKHTKLFEPDNALASACFSQLRIGMRSGGAAEQQAAAAASEMQQSASVRASQMAANREAVLTSWLNRFESIIRSADECAMDEYGVLQQRPGSACSDSGALCSPALSTTSGALSAGSSSPALAASAGTAAAATAAATANATTSNTNQQQQQQQQQLSKEQLYQMFQNILNIKKFEHQLLFNALQLDSSDEQAAAVRRELDGRIARIAELERNKKLMPKFVLKEMDRLYIEEARMCVNKLMVNLDNLPVTKSSSEREAPRGVAAYGLHKFRRYNSSRAQATMTRDGLVEAAHHPSEPQLSKVDVVLTFNIEVIVMEVRGLRHLAPQREIYCTMEIEGSSARLQTEKQRAEKPHWDTQGDFTTNHPLPVLKIKLYAVNASMLSLEDKELGRLVLRPTVLSPKTPEWFAMQPSTSSSSSSSSASMSQATASTTATDGSDCVSKTAVNMNDADQLKIRVIVRMDRPQQLKHCGCLWGIGKSTWRKLKRRYHTLIQVSQYTFVMCAYKDKKAKPTEMLQLDGYTVDYIEPPTDLIMEHCSEITSQMRDAHNSSSHSSQATSLPGLAGRLASALLKQQGSSSSGSASGGARGDSLSSSSSPLSAGGMDASGGGGGGNALNDTDEHLSAIQTAAALSDELHSKFYFNVVKEGDSVVFGCDDEQECFGWVMALYRATGQAHKPTPLRPAHSAYSNASTHYMDSVAFAYGQSSGGGGASDLTALASNGGGGGGPSARSSAQAVDAADQRARKHGMDEFISADPCKFPHNQLFRYMQHETLGYRLKDKFCSLGWFSAGQVMVLDEYSARYGVRTCFRHLSYLDSLLEYNAQRNYFIDHTLLNYGYDFCASHVSGQTGAAGAGAQPHPLGFVHFDLRPDGVGTVTVEERDLFHAIKQKMLKMIERQISTYAYSFPYGKPEGSLKAALMLLERVLMKDQHGSAAGPSYNDEVRALMRKCLEQAALNNYTKLSGQANLATPLRANTLIDELSDAAMCGGGDRATSPQQQQQPSERLLARTHSNLSSSSANSYASSTGTAHTSMSTTTQSGGHTQHESFRQQHHRHQAPARQQQQQQQQHITMAHVINNDHVRPRDKLIYLIRLAELCCEQVEDNNEHFADAFAWHSDLMTEHFELFWSLFSVDMDKILAEYFASPSSNAFASQQTVLSEQQQQQQQQQQQSSLASIPSTLGSLGAKSAAAFAAATQPQLAQQQQQQQQQQQVVPQADGASMGSAASAREPFALFCVLNDHMRANAGCECKKFKQYLCDIFKPRLLRHIDLVESQLTRTLVKATEREGQINAHAFEQMFARLDDLQRFVLAQLRWPDEQLAEQLRQRLKLIAYELCEASVVRAQHAFQHAERKGNKWTASATSTSYVVPVDMIRIINLVLETRTRSLKLCTFDNFDQMSYHSKIDRAVETALADMQPGLMTKLLSALEATLTKLARYDEGNLLAPILSLTTKQGMSSSGRDIGKQYVQFVSNCCDALRQRINDELWIVNLLAEWYAAQMNTICTWLGERIDRSLHEVQVLALSNMMPKVYVDMSLQGVGEDQLALKTYQTIMARVKMEEASLPGGASGGVDAQQQHQQSANNASATSTSAQQNSAQNSTSIFNTASILSSLTSGGSSSVSTTSTTNSSSLDSANATTGAANTLSQQQQQQQQQRRPLSTLVDDATAQMAADAADNNIADRALQSATRMFKGFWAGGNN